VVSPGSSARRKASAWAMRAASSSRPTSTSSNDIQRSAIFDVDE
jgi:hypothetical protein